MPILHGPEGPPRLRWIWRARLVRVIDGDTVVFEIDRGFRSTQIEAVRLIGVDTPEIVGPDHHAAVSARRYADAWLTATTGAWPFLLETFRPGERDSFGRWLADVWRLSDGRNLRDDLIATGHGVARARG